MNMQHLLAGLASATLALGASAQTSINLVQYTVTGDVALATLNGLGLEASAVTYARDRGTLFFVGDEGLGVVEISREGATLGSMAFNWAGTGSSNNDAEGLTYLGNGRLVVVDERPQIAYQFSYSNGGSVTLNDQPRVALTGSVTSVANVGTEGLSVDPRDGSFVSVKQDNPAQLRIATLNFAAGPFVGAPGTAVTTKLLSGTASLFGLNSLSDVQTLAQVDALAGTAAADNLLVLSLDSRKLVEINRAGTVLSSFDLSGLTTQAIEGLTVDERGVIYLVAEDSGTPASRLFTLSPVPEPQTYALMLLGLVAVGAAARRQT